MTHLKHLKFFEAQEYHQTEGLSILKNLINLFQQRIDECTAIAKSYNFNLIQERVDYRNVWQIVLVFNYAERDNVWTLEGCDEFQKLREDLYNLRPLVDSTTKHRFLCNTDVEKLDIENWQTSNKLQDFNKKTGMFENNRNSWPEFVTIKIWLD